MTAFRGILASHFGVWGTRISSIMAARGSDVRSRGTGNDGLSEVRPLEPNVAALDSLEEISSWLGTFRERLRLARSEDRPQVVALIDELQTRYAIRRGELS